MKDRRFSSLLLVRWCYTNKSVVGGPTTFPQLTALLCFVIIFTVGLSRLVSLAEQGLGFLPKTREKQQHNVEDVNIPSRDTILTAKGVVTYMEIEQKVFLPYNYKIIESSFPIPKLDFVSKPSCRKIFEDWLNITSRPAPAEPPKEIKESDKDDFLLNGYSVLYEKFTRFRAHGGPSVCTEPDFRVRPRVTASLASRLITRYTGSLC
ncbi:hypothetical protein Y032_0078g1193 [Ancylostoma ceylanicum]|uniref:Uncharacterized protein n=1 Tax=Ancylostoma ceylanicum TaxID=53326 RepID=A0A016TUQ6_9BILA|nr:hypothetical protein Y032_0078g1193 [Ancylostoma ceylanicum]